MASVMEEEVVRVEPGTVSILTINRPKSLNALNTDVLQSLILAVEKTLKNTDTRVLVIQGAGEKAFVAGADIHGMVDLGPRPIAEYVELGQRAMRLLETCRVPVIASVSGYALGGGLELALACDIIVASANAKVGQPEVNLGIIPGFGGTQRLIHRCGVGTARYLCYSGELLRADAAREVGLIDIVCAPEDLSETTMNLAETIASKAPLAVQKAKEVIRMAVDGTVLAGLRMEVEGFLSLFNTADREEGMRAFLEKRKPDFTGR